MESPTDRGYNLVHYGTPLVSVDTLPDSEAIINMPLCQLGRGWGGRSITFHWPAVSLAGVSSQIGQHLASEKACRDVSLVRLV